MPIEPSTARERLRDGCRPKAERVLHLFTMLLALSQVQASCIYSPPPLLDHGQGADTLGPGNLALSGEGGYGAAGSWWKARNVGDPDVNDGFVGAARARLGVSENIDVGAVGGIGPENALVFGPEMKWRFAHAAESAAEGAPAFHAALISGIGLGAADYRYGPQPRRHFFGAPYTGVLVSGGIQVVQMFTGIRLAASETFGNDKADLTLFPVLAFGAKVNAGRTLGFYAEGDLAGGLTTTDLKNSALLGFASIGASITIERLWTPASAD